MNFKKPSLSFWQIINMNVGFFGIQYSFGLQQTAINPIYSFLGANPEDLPLLNLAGPLTGLLIQPIIGALSDKTWHPKYGRRKPYFLIGAIFCSLCLFAFPFSSALWMAAGLLWVLDAANNTAMEPYRAFVGDKLPAEQQTFGFQVQSLFVGAGITLANISLFVFQKFFNDSTAANFCATKTTAIPNWVYYSFFLGAFCSIASVLWSVLKTPEIPPTDEELAEIRSHKGGIFAPFKEIAGAIKNMPSVLWQLGLVYLFQWYALFCYWQFATPMIKKTLFNINDADESKAHEILKACQQGINVSAADLSFSQNIYQSVEAAVGHTGLMNGFYNFVTMLVALSLVPIAKKYTSKITHVICLFFTAIALLSLPMIHEKYMIFIPMVLFGIGWASMMGLPYAMVSGAIPKSQRGVYMGIINMMIVIPMLIQTLSFGYIYKHLLGDNPSNAIYFAGVLMFLAALATLRMQAVENKDEEVVMSGGGH